MEVDCEGCAGCCIDWRALTSEASDHERRGRHSPLDDHYNFVPLSRDDVVAFSEAGYADALSPRLWADPDGIPIDGTRIAAIDDRLVFFLGPRQTPKPVGPFGTDPAWLPTCVFLDPVSLQCRIHESPLYPEECAGYPGHNLKLGAETECERVEAAFGGDRLLDGTVPTELSGLLLGQHAVGQKVFVHPDPDRLSGVIDRLRARDLTRQDRAEFVAAAIANSPGTTAVDHDRFTAAIETVREAESWAGIGVESWRLLSETEQPDPNLARRAEESHGAPSTPGWSNPKSTR